VAIQISVFFHFEALDKQSNLGFLQKTNIESDAQLFWNHCNAEIIPAMDG